MGTLWKQQPILLIASKSRCPLKKTSLNQKLIGDRKFKTTQANRNYLKWQTETWNVRIVPLKKVANFFKNLLTFTYLCGIIVIVQRGMKTRVATTFGKQEL